jgi:hypothetical protein
MLGPRGRTRCLAAITAAVVGVLAGCGSATDGPAPAPAPPPARTAEPEPPAATLPDLVGKGLQTAEDEAQAAGFFALTSHDALGQTRDQVLDREWTVCFQDPTPGPAPGSTLVVLGAVRLGEACPATDLGAEAALADPTAETDADTVPDVVGLSVAQATRSLGTEPVTLRDATGAGRPVDAARNWQVCAQEPAAGGPRGAPVTLTAVTLAEDC